MQFLRIVRAALLLSFLMGWMAHNPAMADGDLKKVKHVVVIMQENHSFDNYFGALPYAPGSPYHPSLFGCRKEDHACVDGLLCLHDKNGELKCFNVNKDDDGSLVTSFHDPKRCASPDLDHSWLGTHQEMNFLHPNNTLPFSLSNGFVRVNDKTEQVDTASRIAPKTKPWVSTPRTTFLFITISPPNSLSAIATSPPSSAPLFPIALI